MIENHKYTRILLVEDDVNLGFLLVDFLESNGFEVKLYRDGQSALQGFKRTGSDFCLIDIMLPGMDGFTLTAKIKELDRDIPVIILSARSLKEDKITGFRLGVDDYITKPFDEEELLYRIRAVLGRMTRSATESSGEAEIIKIGRFVFDPKNLSLIHGGNLQRMTIKESRILGKLTASVNNIVTREEIMIDVWGEADYYTGRSLDVFISKLRGYLKSDPSVRIVTIPTLGYKLEAG
ncbi:MAG: response regulator transcription factor [Bacteroidales bacterium]|jgi:DNA-binding response OmpR family regulator|nr:response regulator transcription factor [Bacteroidales bacterium]